MVKLFTIAKKGGNNGKLWNGAHPEQFFPFMHQEGVKKIWDVRRSTKEQFGSFFEGNILKWCCEHDSIEYTWREDFAPARELFKQCDAEGWDLYKYAQAYFTDGIIAALNKVERAEELDGVAVLCAEQELFNCHRLLIAEYFKAKFGEIITLKHLGLAYDKYGLEKDSPSKEALYNTRQYIKQLLAK